VAVSAGGRYEPFGPLRPGGMPLHPDQAIFADGVTLGAVAVPDNQPIRGGPALLFAFSFGGRYLGKPVLLAPIGAVAQLVADAIASTEDPEWYAESIAKAEAAQAAYQAEVHCPGCGRRIFAEVAARGACLDCFPKIPDDG
jgi:hypothetical protein